jgi:hypothetical protein
LKHISILISQITLNKAAWTMFVILIFLPWFHKFAISLKWCKCTESLVILFNSIQAAEITTQSQNKLLQVSSSLQTSLFCIPRTIWSKDSLQKQRDNV